MKKEIPKGWQDAESVSEEKQNEIRLEIIEEIYKSSFVSLGKFDKKDFPNDLCKVSRSVARCIAAASAAYFMERKRILNRERLFCDSFYPSYACGIEPLVIAAIAFLEWAGIKDRDFNFESGQAILAFAHGFMAVEAIDRGMDMLGEDNCLSNPLEFWTMKKDTAAHIALRLGVPGITARITRHGE